MIKVKYIGLDVHQASISVAVLDENGKLLMQSVLATQAAAIVDFLEGLRGTLQVTLEEGTYSAWLYDLLKPHVARVVVCNPRQTALLKHGNKNDRIDAGKLANLLRLDSLEPVYHGQTGVRTLREIGAQLSNHRQRSFPGEESAESALSQLGNPLRGPGRLLHPPSQSVVGKNTPGRNAPSR